MIKRTNKKNVLFIYLVCEGLGVVSKVSKIEQGFRDADCSLTVKGILIHERKLPRVIQMAKFFVNIMFTLVTNKYDVVFVRHTYHFIVLFFLFWILRVKIQLEINSKEKEEFMGRGQWIRAQLGTVSLSLACRCAVRVHAVTYELLNHYKALYPKVSIVVNPNFVVDEEYSNDNVVEDCESTHLIFLGDTLQPWQGIDLFIGKIVIDNLCFLKKCCLHIVGECSGEIRRLIESSYLQEKIIIHGYLSGQEKRDVINKMHIGIGVFNLEAKSMIEATPIKIGEYLYAGLPVIIGYYDPRLPDSLDMPMWLRINLHEQCDLHERVNSFIAEVRQYALLRSKVHEFAKQHLLVKNYVNKILE